MFTTLLLATAIAAMGPTVPADAHKLTEKNARKAVARSATKAAEKTLADGYGIASCSRLTRHKWECAVELRYSGEVSRCELPVTVTASHRTRKLRRVLGETLCY